MFSTYVFFLFLGRKYHDKYYLRVGAWLLGWHTCDGTEVSIIHSHPSIFLFSTPVPAVMSQLFCQTGELCGKCDSLQLQICHRAWHGWLMTTFISKSHVSLCFRRVDFVIVKSDEMPRRWSEQSYPKIHQSDPNLFRKRKRGLAPLFLGPRLHSQMSSLGSQRHMLGSLQGIPSIGLPLHWGRILVCISYSAKLECNRKHLMLCFLSKTFGGR